jgi:hypothetical protein
LERGDTKRKLIENYHPNLKKLVRIKYLVNGPGLNGDILSDDVFFLSCFMVIGTEHLFRPVPLG